MNPVRGNVEGKTDLDWNPCTMQHNEHFPKTLFLKQTIFSTHVYQLSFRAAGRSGQTDNEDYV